MMRNNQDRRVPVTAPDDSLLYFGDVPVREIAFRRVSIHDISDDEPIPIDLSKGERNCPKSGPHSPSSIFDVDSPLQDDLFSVSDTVPSRHERTGTDNTSVYFSDENERMDDETIPSFYSICTTLNLDDGSADPSVMCAQIGEGSIKSMSPEVDFGWQERSVVSDVSSIVGTPSPNTQESHQLSNPQSSPKRRRNLKKRRTNKRTKGKGAKSSAREFEKLHKLMIRTASSRCLLLQQSELCISSSPQHVESLKLSVFKSIISSTKLRTNTPNDSSRSNNDVLNISTSTSSGLPNCVTGGSVEQSQEKPKTYTECTRSQTITSLPSCGSLVSLPPESPLLIPHLHVPSFCSTQKPTAPTGTTSKHSYGVSSNSIRKSCLRGSKRRNANGGRPETFQVLCRIDSCGKSNKTMSRKTILSLRKELQQTCKLPSMI